jgi:hypothetical protein
MNRELHQAILARVAKNSDLFRRMLNNPEVTLREEKLQEEFNLSEEEIEVVIREYRKLKLNLVGYGEV